MSITKFYSEYTCDYCGKKETSYRAYAAPSGWIEVVVREYADDIPDDKEYQFDTKECLKEYLSD